MLAPLTLFAGTLCDNLAMALPRRDDDDMTGNGTTDDDAMMWEALERAHIADFVRAQPDGLDMTIDQDAANLSGGQRQRIGLARVFLRDAALVMFDEPTSRLDALNEAVILRSIRDTSEGRAVVLVSHRESALRIADTRCDVLTAAAADTREPRHRDGALSYMAVSRLSLDE